MQNCSAETNLEGIKLTFPKGGFNRAYSPPESLCYGRVLDYKCRSINSGNYTVAPYTYSYSKIILQHFYSAPYSYRYRRSCMFLTPKAGV